VLLLIFFDVLFLLFWFSSTFLLFTSAFILPCIYFSLSLSLSFAFSNTRLFASMCIHLSLTCMNSSPSLLLVRLAVYRLNNKSLLSPFHQYYERFIPGKVSNRSLTIEISIRHTIDRDKQPVADSRRRRRRRRPPPPNSTITCRQRADIKPSRMRVLNKSSSMCNKYCLRFFRYESMA
jgi:hypothetical protein